MEFHIVFNLVILAGLVVTKVYAMTKVWRRDRLLEYQDVITVVATITYAAVVVNADINNGTILGSIASVGIAFWIAYFGLLVFHTTHAAMSRRKRTYDYGAALDRVVRWTALVALVVCFINVGFDTMMHESGTRIDLAVADLFGFMLAFYCLERASQQMRVAYQAEASKMA